MDPDTFFNNPCPVPPSVHQTEQRRQADVAASRALVYGGSLTAAPEPVDDARYFWRIVTVLVLLVAFIVTFKEPTFKQPAAAPNLYNLEQRVTQLEKQERIAHELAVMHNGEIDDLQKIIGETKEVAP